MFRFPARRHALPLLLLGGTACALATPEKVYLSQVQAPVATAKAADAALARFATDGFTGSVLIARGSRVLLYKGYGDANRARELPNNAETKYPFGTLTSTFTAAAILGLEAEGRLRLDQPAAELVGSEAGTATIAELLAPDAAPRVARAARYGSDPAVAAPATRSALLDRVLEGASGQPAAQAIRDRVIVPAGLTRTVMDDGTLNDSLVARGYTGPYGETVVVTGLVGPLADLYRWHQALRLGTFLPLAERHQMIAPAGSGYGPGWSVGRTADGARVIEHVSRQPGFELWYGYFPEQDLLILLAANNDGGFREPIAARLTSLLLGNGAVAARPDVTKEQRTGGS